MIGTSLPEWIFIRVSIFVLQRTPLLYAAALAVLFLNYGPSALSFFITRILSAALLAETLFFCFIYRPFLHLLQQDACHPKPLSAAERRDLFRKCMDTLPSVEMYLQGWFLGAPIEEIRRENLKDFILWGFFEERSGNPSSDEASQDLDELIAIIENKMGRQLREGRGDAQSLRLTFDEVQSTYRSLAWYLIVFVIDQLTHLAFLWYGFEHYRIQPNSAPRIFPPRPQEFFESQKSPCQLSYWHRPHSASSNRLPVVFFHGIGIGLWTYVRFLAKLAKGIDDEDGDCGIIAIEMLPVSFRLAAPVPTKAEFLDQMMTIVDHHCWKDFAIASHSYGSILTAHMLHSPKLHHRIHSVTLIDPVTIMLHLPQVAYNFTRRKPRMANEWLLWYFASTDPAVALCLGRHFFWREGILWKDELLVSESGGQRTERTAVVSLAGRDLIVETAMVWEYLKDNEAESLASLASNEQDKLKVLMFPHLDHAQLFHDYSASASVISLTQASCRTDTSAA